MNRTLGKIPKAKALIARLKVYMDVVRPIQRIVATELKIQPVTLSRWLNGSQLPMDDEVLARLEKYLKKHEKEMS